MRFNVLVAMTCGVGSTLAGLLAAGSFAATPLPEGYGSKCYDAASNTCHTIGTKQCQQVGECVYCSSGSAILSTYCSTSFFQETCTISGTTKDCGDLHTGVCGDEGGSCTSGGVLIETDGCDSVDVGCTGTAENP
jgi:hypothetical protein